MKKNLVVGLLWTIIYFASSIGGAFAQYLTPAVNSPLFPSIPSAGWIPIASSGSTADWEQISGDATLSSLGALTFQTVNSNVGSFGSATQCITFTVNAKGLITAASAATCTPAVGSVTGLGTGVATALGVNVGTAGAFVVNGGALGTPSSGNGTNITNVIAAKVTDLTTTVTGATAGNLQSSTNSGCTSTTPCLNDSGIAASNVPLLNAANVFTAAQTITLNNLIGFTIQDASSSQDTLKIGVASSVTCDPGLTVLVASLPGTGPCGEINVTPNVVGAWQTLLLEATNGRAVFGAAGGIQNPEITCADTNAFGVIVPTGSGAGNQSGCGYTSAARINSGSPVTFNFVAGGYPQSTITASNANGIGGNGLLTVTAQSGKPVVFGESFVGAGFTVFKITGTSGIGSGNCSPACTGSGGNGTYASSITTVIGSETMIGGPSGAENSASIQIYGGSLAGDAQNILMFFNYTGCASVDQNCSATKAGARLGEIAGTGMSGDGLFTQTETGSWNIYAAANFSGTHLDGSYTAPTNMVLRLAPNSSAPQRIDAVFDYNANLFLGTSWTITTASSAVSGALFVGPSVPTNQGLMNNVYAPASQQGMTIQNSGGDTGTGHAVLFSRTDGTTEGSIVISASGTAFNTTSDRRLKTDIVPASSDEVGSLIDRLQVVDFKFKDDLTKKFIGFIAQDEYAVFPDAISKGDDSDAKPGDVGFVAWGRDDSKLVPLLVREVQALRNRVATLEARH